MSAIGIHCEPGNEYRNDDPDYGDIPPKQTGEEGEHRIIIFKSSGSNPRTHFIRYQGVSIFHDEYVS